MADQPRGHPAEHRWGGLWSWRSTLVWFHGNYDVINVIYVSLHSTLPWTMLELTSQKNVPWSRTVHTFSAPLALLVKSDFYC